MKNTLKTIAYSFMAMALFGFSAQTVLAATVFNNHAQDRPTVRVSNYTNNPGSNSNWSSSISANPGDIIAVTVYYHNNGSESAVSTKLKINNGQNIGSAYTHTFSGSVSASNAPMVSGSATVNIPSSQSLTYVPGSAKWYPNQGSSSQSLPNGQSGTEIFTSSGANIGSIAQGWPSQGSFVVQYKVSEAQQVQAPIVTTNSYSLNSNTQVTLNGHVNGQGQNPYTWFVYGTNSNLPASSQTTSQSYQSVTSTNFSETVNVNANTTYYYKACALTNQGGTACGQILSFTTGGNNNNQSINVVTNNATNVEQYSAKLNGTVENTGGSQVSSLMFYYGTNASNLYSTVYANPSSVNNPSSFSYQLNNLNTNTTYYFKACGTSFNSGVENCGSIRSFKTSNIVDNNDEYIEVETLSAQNVGENNATLRGNIVETNGESVVRYFEYGTNQNNLNQSVSVSGSTSNTGNFSRSISGLNSNTTYYFRACIDSQNSGVEDCGSIRSFKTSKFVENNNDDYCIATASTTYATGISSTSAVLNGVSTAGNSSANSYFQYGTNSNLGSNVGSQTVSSCGTLYNSYNLTGLQSNKTYYYRIVTGGTYGEIKSFTTSQNTVVIVESKPNKPVTVIKTEGTGGVGMVYLALDITPDFDNLYKGDVVNFEVDYRNLYNGTLKDVVINVRFPEEIEFRKSTKGFYSQPNRSLVVALGDLEKDEKGTILIQASVLGRLNNQDVVVTTAEGTYDHPIIENAQGSSLAHALNTILENHVALGAFAFGAGIFPGMFGWLFLILIILLIIWISRKIYNDHQDRKNQKPTFQIN